MNHLPLVNALICVDFKRSVVVRVLIRLASLGLPLPQIRRGIEVRSRRWRTGPDSVSPQPHQVVLADRGPKRDAPGARKKVSVVRRREQPRLPIDDHLADAGDGESRDRKPAHPALDHDRRHSLHPVAPTREEHDVCSREHISHVSATSQEHRPLLESDLRNSTTHGLAHGAIPDEEVDRIGHSGKDATADLEVIEGILLPSQRAHRQHHRCDSRDSQGFSDGNTTKGRGQATRVSRVRHHHDVIG